MHDTSFYCSFSNYVYHLHRSTCNKESSKTNSFILRSSPSLILIEIFFIFSIICIILHIFFCRKDSFITHRAFCDALAEESARLMAATTDAAEAIGMTTSTSPPLLHHPLFLPFSSRASLPNPNPNCNTSPYQVKPHNTLPSLLHHLPTTTSPYLSATALLQRASTMGPTTTTTTTTSSAAISTAAGGQMGSSMFNAGDPSAWQRSDRLTRDFLGAVAGETGEEELLSLTGAFGLDLVTAASCDRGDHAKHFPGFPPVNGTWGDC